MGGEREREIETEIAGGIEADMDCVKIEKLELEKWRISSSYAKKRT